MPAREQPVDRPAPLPPTIQYSLHARLGGGGIGNIAAHAVEALHASRSLKRLFVSSSAMTALPPHLVRQWGAPGRGLKYAASRDPSGLADWLGDVLFDAWVSRQLTQGDVFHVWSAHGLHSLRRARQLGLVTVVDRASTHPATQRRLLAAERSRWGIPGREPHWHLRRSVQELIEADFVIVPSRFARDSLLAEGVPPRKLIEVPFGVDLQHFVPAPDRPEVPFRAIFVGQVSLRKGVPDLLEAWRSLGWRNSELWVVGRLDTDMRRLWPRWAHLAGLRHIPHTADVATLLRQAHVFVFPSIEEGSALVTYEALASGLPVVATANAGSVVQDGVQGFMVEAQNPQALSARLDQLRADACLRRAMGAAARRLAEGYPWAGYGQRLLEAYRQMTMAA